MENPDIVTPAGRPRVLFPPLAGSTVSTVLLAGLGADLGWEVWARVVTPILPGVGGPLEPAGLIQSVFGFHNRPVGEAIHVVVGVVLYPLAFLLIARPLQRALLPRLPWWLTALGFGIGLFVFALYVMAHLVAGLPSFLGWTPLTYASLTGHLLFGLGVGWIVRLRDGATAHSAPSPLAFIVTADPALDTRRSPRGPAPR